MYILTSTAKRKNAKRHIYGRYNSIEDLMRTISYIKSGDTPRYNYGVATGNYKIVCEDVTNKSIEDIRKEVINNEHRVGK